jgi:hypothetical protein
MDGKVTFHSSPIPSEKDNLKGQCHEFFCFWFFFINQFPPSPRVSHLDRFEFFQKIRGDIRRSRLTTGVNDTGGK